MFVFDVKIQDDSDKIRLILNTKDEISPAPKNRFVQNENLYIVECVTFYEIINLCLLFSNNTKPVQI